MLSSIYRTCSTVLYTYRRQLTVSSRRTHAFLTISDVREIHRTRLPPTSAVGVRLPPSLLSVGRRLTAWILQVVANDKGEVVVRPRGLWEGRPVHGVLAGPNSSMPPNCEQPDLLVGAYTFDCLKASTVSPRLTLQGRVRPTWKVDC